MTTWGKISSSQNYTQTFWDWFLRIRIETKQSGTRRVPAGTVSSQMLQEHFSESASHSRRPMPKGQAASKTDLNFRTKLRHRFNDLMCKYNQIHVAHPVVPLSSSLDQRKLGQSRKTFGSRLCLEVSLRQGASQSAEESIVRPRRPRNI